MIMPLYIITYKFVRPPKNDTLSKYIVRTNGPKHTTHRNNVHYGVTSWREETYGDRHMVQVAEKLSTRQMCASV